MTFKVQKTNLEGVFQITPPTIFDDFRGRYVEIYNKKLYQDAGINYDYVQDDYAISQKNVLRGIHGDEKTAKLVKCIYGKIYMVVVNNDKDSKEFRKWQAFTISHENCIQVSVPPKFGIGFLVLSDEALFHYKQNTYYGEAKQFTIKWDDPEYKIWWPRTDMIISQRDMME